MTPSRKPVSDPVITRVVRVEQLSPVEGGKRRLICAWSDDTVSEALAFYDSEMLVSEGDLVGLTAAEVRSLHFRRDREYLQRDDI